MREAAAALYRAEDKAAASNPFVAAILKSTKVDTFEVWPDNWRVWCLFDRRMRTQWRSGPGGYTGLDYNVLFDLFALMDLSKVERTEMLDDIGVLEDAALAEIHAGTE